ncbi:MAG: homoserine kinase [Elusimicrobia bacterium]|nr:homoserine kinase [Elusimicrobiota bacterium]
MKKRKFIFEIPGSIGNFGCGFDVLGAAVEIKNRFVFEVAGGNFSVDIKVKGYGKNILENSANNPVWKSAEKVFRKIGFSYRNLGKIEILEENAIPLKKGLGSSATARLAGAFFANEVSGRKLGKNEILEIVAKMEGHFDNAAASLFGGIVISTQVGRNIEISRLKKAVKNPVVIAVPALEISTDEARKILPKNYAREDVVFNLSRVASLIHGLNRGDVFPFMFEDKIHTPFRKNLIKGFDEVKKAAISSGAKGFFICGSGPSLGVLAPSRIAAKKLSLIMKKAFSKKGIRSEILITRICEEGITIRKG